MNRIYMDANATTPLLPEVFEAMRPFFLEDFGNAGSRTHSFGQRAKQATEQAREEVAKLVNARSDDVVFTSGATESTGSTRSGGGTRSSA